MNNYELAEKDYQAGMKYKDIATKYNVTLNTVKSWKTRYWKKETEEKGSAEKVCTQNKSMHTLKKGAEEKLIPDIKEEIEKIDAEGLTGKQRLFCDYYIKTFNATQSAIKAGYSKNTAYAIGAENLKKPQIKNYLTKLRDAYMEDEYLDTKRLLERHRQIAFYDVNDYVNDDGTLKDLSECDGSLIRKVSAEKTNIEQISEIGEEKKTKTKEVIKTNFELEDRSKSLIFLTKFYGLDPDTNIAKERLKIEKDKVYGTGNGEGKASGNIEKAKNILIKLRGNNESNR